MAAWNFEAEALHSGSLVAVAGVWNVVGQWLIRRLLEKGYRLRSALSTRPGKELLNCLFLYDAYLSKKCDRTEISLH